MAMFAAGLFQQKRSGPQHRDAETDHSMFTATVLLRQKGFVDFNDQVAYVRSRLDEFFGRRVIFQLVSAHSVSETDGAGLISKSAELQSWSSRQDQLAADQGSTYSMSFTLPRQFGRPGALLVTNNHHYEFYLKSVTLHDVGSTGQDIYFPCNSWIYNAKNYDGPRVFFTNQAYLPHETPPGLRCFRNMELQSLRGDGTGERKKADRIYDYDVYNDLGNPDKGEKYARPTLGGSKEFPYPRRCRTGRGPNKSNPMTEKPVSLFEFIYVPRDEIFDYTKAADFIASSLRAVTHLLLPLIKSLFTGRDCFKKMDDVYDLYAEGIDLSTLSIKITEEDDRSRAAFETLSKLTTDRSTGNTSLLKFPLPLVIYKNKDAWDTDAEFGRQMLGGMHPMMIERMKVFPLVSELAFGQPISIIRAHHIEPYLEGMTAGEALKKNKLYILDYQSAFLPFIVRINELENHKAYASRCIFYLTKRGALMPVAIELSLPTENGRFDRVFVPPTTSDEYEHWLWKLAKTHAILNDTAVHQVGSHYLRTHASLEPVIIASHRQLSTMHPLMILLLPHFKNTLNINALARKILINADTGNLTSGGFVESTFTAGRYVFEISSAMYKSWQFNEQGLPADLLKRGIAVLNSNAKHGLTLLIEDYPYAVDGLEVWDAIETWVREYVGIFYETDIAVKHDEELQSWWQELIERGHADKKDEPWWPSMHNIENLVSIVTTIIWLASAHHAAVNFGQYPFAGHMLYRPTMGRRLIPSPNTPDFDAFHENPEAFVLSSVSSPLQTVLGLAIIELLSTHASNEEYLGQRSSKNWTSNDEVMNAFKRFQRKLRLVEQNITERNCNPLLANRYGEIQVPYTLLFPTSTEGITNRGIPNSTSV